MLVETTYICTFAREQHVLPDTVLFYVDRAEVHTYYLLTIDPAI